MKKIYIIPLIFLFSWGCMSFNPNYRLGAEALLARNWEQAVKYFEKAALENPKEPVYRMALMKAKNQASLHHWVQAQTLVSQGKKEEAKEEYRKALSYNPRNFRMLEELKVLLGEKEAVVKPEPAPIEPPVKLKYDHEPMDIDITETDLRAIFSHLGKHAGINMIFDKDFKNSPYALKLEKTNFENALQTLCLATKCFFVPLNEKSVIISPDTPLKRQQYEFTLAKTFYLSNVEAEVVKTQLTAVLTAAYKRVGNVVSNKESNSIFVKTTPKMMEIIEKIVNLWDKPKAEVILELQIMEVSRTNLSKLGIEFDKLSVGVQNTSGLTSASSWRNLKDLNFSKGGSYQISLPTSLLQFLETDSDTKLIAQSQLRGIHKEEIKYIVGDEVPIPKTSFQSYAIGGIQNQPITQFDFKNVGIEVTLTPSIHRENEVTVELDLKVKSIGEAGYADIPIIGTREVKNVMRLKHGETNLLFGLIKEEERQSIKGIAGLKNIPGLGALFSSNDNKIQQTDIIMTLTPYIIRNVQLTKEDFEPIWFIPEGTGSPENLARQSGNSRMTEEDEEARSFQRREESATGQSRVILSPEKFEIPKGRQFRISMSLRGQEKLTAFATEVSYDPQVVKLLRIVPGAILNQGGKKIPFLENINNSSGMCTIGFSAPDPENGISGVGKVVTLVFNSINEGECIISLNSTSASTVSGSQLSLKTNNSRVKVR